MTSSQMELLTDLTHFGLTPNLNRAIKALREGKVILVLDAHERENEGDLIVAAEKISADSMNFLIKKGSGVVCLALPKKRLDHLGLPLMIPENTNFFQTAFTVSIEARCGVTTGVSAKDRAHTIMTAMNEFTKSEDLARPGHVFPLAAKEGGVFERMGHTEGSVDLTCIAGLKPGAVLCELMNEDGSMTIGEDRSNFAKRFDIPVVSIEEIFCYRIKTEDVVKKSTKTIATRFGQCIWQSFNFLDSTSVEVFSKENLENSNSPVKISLISGDNLPNRFLMQVLSPSDDDPLISALMDQKDGKNHLVMMISTHRKSARMTKQELSLRQNAAICRALLELNVKRLDASFINDELRGIAKNYFSIEVV